MRLKTFATTLTKYLTTSLFVLAFTAIFASLPLLAQDPPDAEQRIKTTVTIPPVAPVSPGGPVLEITDSGARLLSDYDVELIVDKSMSMRKMDCPAGLSRWDWCGAQANELGRQLNPYVPRGLTITAFAREYSVYRNSTPGNIADLFSRPSFGIGTRLAQPLSDRLNDYFIRRKSGTKPVLIAVITDGVPHPKSQPVMVASILVNASRQMKSANEITVVFLQIGARSRFGREFLNYLDNELVNNGAKYDFVKTVPFDHLAQVGLSQALVESIEQFAGNRVDVQAPSPARKKKSSRLNRF
jgi:hypothetical protein